MKESEEKKNKAACFMTERHAGYFRAQKFDTARASASTCGEVAVVEFSAWAFAPIEGNAKYSIPPEAQLRQSCELVL